MAKNPKETIQSTIIDQNSCLMILQGETPFMQSSDSRLKTEAGMASSLPQAPQGDPETMASKFYKENHDWILDEVEKYLDQN